MNQRRFSSDAVVSTTSSRSHFELAERRALIQTSPLFAGISAEACTLVAEQARSQSFIRNESLFTQGEPFRTLVIIEAGCVKLTQLNANGTQIIVGLRGPSDVVDLPSTLLPQAHSFGATAVVRCKAITLSSSRLEALMTRIPAVSMNMCGILARQLHDLQQRYQEMSCDRVESRVASTLVRLTCQFGRSTSKGTIVAFSREELAQMTGTTLFTVSRLMSKWKAMGLIVPRREAVLMINAHALEIVGSWDHDRPRPALATCITRKEGLIVSTLVS